MQNAAPHGEIGFARCQHIGGAVPSSVACRSCGTPVYRKSRMCNKQRTTSPAKNPGICLPRLLRLSANSSYCSFAHDQSDEGHFSPSIRHDEETVLRHLHLVSKVSGGCFVVSQGRKLKIHHSESNHRLSYTQYQDTSFQHSN